MKAAVSHGTDQAGDVRAGHLFFFFKISINDIRDTAGCGYACIFIVCFG